MVRTILVRKEYRVRFARRCFLVSCYSSVDYLGTGVAFMVAARLIGIGCMTDLHSLGSWHANT